MIFEMHHFFENIWIFVKLLFIGSLNFNCASPWIMNKAINNRFYLLKKIKHQNYSASNLTPTTSNFVKYFVCKSLHWYVIVYTCWKFTNNQNVANRNYFVIFPFSKPDPYIFDISVHIIRCIDWYLVIKYNFHGIFQQNQWNLVKMTLTFELDL